MTGPSGRVLILGAGGLLGRALVATCTGAGRPFVALTQAQCDISRTNAVQPAIAAARPTLIVNAAGATDVDRCERDPIWARRVNAFGPMLLAREARAIGARFVHISTDYVFDGERADGAYVEDDAPNPLSVYAKSKREGERRVLAELPNALCLRTAWLYGPGGHNFATRIPSLLRDRGQLEAVADQYSSPTAASSLAPWILHSAERARGGVYHVVNPGCLSYYDLARTAATALGIDPARVQPIAAASLRLPAPRPRRTPLASTALFAEGLPQLEPAAEVYRRFFDQHTTFPTAGDC